jgi:GNAT superfamily N-acetyltransferase
MKVTVKCDEFTDYATKCFDFDFDGTTEFTPPEMPDPPKNFNIGIIYGSSGSGKSTLLKRFGVDYENKWDYDRAVVSHFKSPEIAVDRLSSVGFNSIPSWMRPYHVLSTGEKFRADMAMSVCDNAVIDEFTSVVNRSVAKSASVSISKFIRRNDIKNVVFASCHDDIIDWIEPDWSFNTDTAEMTVGRWRRRPTIRLEIYRTDHSLWETFKRHHYLSADLNKCCTCFKAVFDGKVIGFSASIPMPSRIPPLYDGDERKKYRESRTVILPDYQGFGVGVRFSDAIAQYWLERGYRFFSKTAHVRMGEHRQRADFWRPTSTNLKSREKAQKCSKSKAWHRMMLDTKRICYSHEYIGMVGYSHRDLYDKRIGS